MLNTDSTIGDLLLNSGDRLEFYSVSYLKEELYSHKAKLMRISKLSSDEIDQIKTQIFSKIQFISEDVIPFEYWKKAINYVREVDMDDIAFVALSLYMDNTMIWTGDSKLRLGIIKKGRTRPKIIRCMTLDFRRKVLIGGRKKISAASPALASA
ncbi:MAG TPA: hypothetical protein ENJ45_05705 [Phaeodactylibacter sp.]|nr:hypothetical protein [Phaeodactylibacter sp.]